MNSQTLKWHLPLQTSYSKSCSSLNVTCHLGSPNLDGSVSVQGAGFVSHLKNNVVSLSFAYGEKGNKIVRTLQEKIHHDLLQEKKERGVTKGKESDNSWKTESVCMRLTQLIYTVGERMQAQPNSCALFWCNWGHNREGRAVFAECKSAVVQLEISYPWASFWALPMYHCLHPGILFTHIYPQLEPLARVQNFHHFLSK